jgi:UDP-sugar transporter A1/2/3
MMERGHHSGSAPAADHISDVEEGLIYQETAGDIYNEGSPHSGNKDNLHKLKNKDSSVRASNVRNHSTHSLNKPETLPPSSPLPPQDPNSNIMMKLVYMGLVVIFSTSISLLIRYSQHRQPNHSIANEEAGGEGVITAEDKPEGGTYKYQPSAVVFSAEMLKLILSFAMACKSGVVTKDFIQRHFIEDKDLWKFSVPAIIYFCTNNLEFYCLMFLNTPTFMIFQQMKILTTGIIFRIVFKKKLTNLQWVALFLLTLGTMTSQLSSENQFSVNTWGLFWEMVMCTLSALAGVANEFLLKKVGTTDSIHIQNMKLYIFGVAANFLEVIRSGTPVGSMFQGMDHIVFMIVLVTAFNGLAISAVMKYANVIVKTISTSLSLLLSAVISLWLFHFKPTITLFDGIFIIFCAIYCYNYESTLAPSPASASGGSTPNQQGTNKK